jgi:phosphate/sulfate permease
MIDCRSITNMTTLLKTSAVAFMAVAMLLMNPCDAFSSHVNQFSSQKIITESTRLGPLHASRRSFISKSAAAIFSGAVVTSVVGPNDIANALPMITVFEFEQILKDSGERNKYIH